MSGRPTPVKLSAADVRALAVLAALIAIVSWNRLTVDLWLARHDLLTFFLAWYGHLGERLRDLDVPGWNPYVFSGAPFAGDPESGWMYLPAMLFFPFLPVLTAFKAMVVVQLVVAALSTYALARVMGVGAVAGLVAAVVFTFGPLLHHSTYCCTVRAQLAMWIPLALLGVELALRADRWRDRVVPWFLSGFAISQMFAGWTGQGVMDGLLVVAAFVCYRALISPPHPGRDLRTRLAAGAATGLAILGLGLALGAAGILPRFVVNQQTHIPGGDYSELGQPHKMPPQTLESLLSSVMGDGYDARWYALGGTAIILSLLAPFLARRRYAVPFFAGLTLAVYTLTLDTTPLHQLFYLIPRFQMLHEHSPHQVTAVVGIGPAMLSAATVESLAAWRGRRRLLPLVVAPFLLYAVVAILLAHADRPAGRMALLAAGVVTALIWLVVDLPRRYPARPWLRGAARLVPVLILAIAFVQPTGVEIVASALGRPIDRDWRPYWISTPPFERAVAVNVAETDPGGAGEFLQARQAEAGPEPVRYVGYGGVGHPSESRGIGTYMDRRRQPNIQAVLVNARAIFLELYHIQGYNPLQLKRYADFVNTMNGTIQNYHVANLQATGVTSPLLNLLNVRYILVDATLPQDREDVVALTAGRREVFRTDLVIVYENADAFPHAWIVHGVIGVERDNVATLLTSEGIDFRETALVEGELPDVAPGNSAAESARVTHYEPDAMTIAVTATAPGLLVVSEVYESGWRAYVDGERVDILPANLALRGIPIPAGDHVIEMRYEPLSLRLGLWISGVAMAVMLAVFAIAAWVWVRRGGRLHVQP